MGKEALRSELQNLERKIKLLLNEYSLLKAETHQLKAENENLKMQLNSRDEVLTNFQNQSKISRIVDSMIVENGKEAELRNVIEDYIKEIDKCIAHLGEA